MKFKTEYFFCSPKLLENIDEVQEIFKCIEVVRWEPDYYIYHEGKTFYNQSGYNKAFENEFGKYNWQQKPVLCEDPKFIGDFMKNDIFERYNSVTVPPCIEIIINFTMA